MSLPSEQNKQKSLSLSQLVQRNAQSLETREQIPYQHTVYAIPEEWRKKEEQLLADAVQLLADAVQFQPTLYRLIEALATYSNIVDMQNTVLQRVNQRCTGMEDKVERFLQQDGRKREEYSSDLSRKLLESLQDLRNTKAELEQTCRKWVLITAAVSVVSSTLACVLCLLLAG